MMYGSLKPQKYIARHIDVLMGDYLRSFGGVEIRGPRWCGKSWSAQAFGQSITRVDRDATLFEDEPSLALQGKQPHIIDEWQDVVAIWNEVRHAIDDSANSPGQYILTGSSSPLASAQSASMHSGAGRIAHLDMSTMTLTERGISTNKVSLQNLFAGKFEPAESGIGLESISQFICEGGWPAVVAGEHVDAETAIDSYLNALFENSIPKTGKSGDRARKIALSLARNVGTSATLKTIAGDVGDRNACGRLGGNKGVNTSAEATYAATTVSSYIEEFKRNFFVYELPAWDAPVKSKSRVRSSPKRYFADPSIAAALLGVDFEHLLYDRQLFGVLFESLAVHDMQAYVRLLKGAYPNSLRYYSDADGLEVDMIIELRDGKWAGIEVKTGVSGIEKAVSNLNRLRKKVQKNPKARNPKPEFMAVLLASYPYARYLKDDDIYLIPIETLCP